MKTLMLILISQIIQCISMDTSSRLLARARHTTVHPQQNLETLLKDLDDKLRSLTYYTEGIRYCFSRHDLSLDTIMRRLDGIDNRMSILQHKIDSVSQITSSSVIKEQMLERDAIKEHILRKIDANQEKLYNKIEFVESHLESKIHKTQDNIYANVNRLTRKFVDVESSIDILNKNVDEISVKLDNKLNSSFLIEQYKNFHGNVATQEHMQKLSNVLDKIHDKFNNTSQYLNPNDSPGESIRENEKILDHIKISIKDESHKLGNKISNMFTDLSSRLQTVEGYVKESVGSTNLTRLLLQDNLKTLRRNSMELEAQDNYIEIAMNSLALNMQKKINDLNRNINDNFENLIKTTNILISTNRPLDVPTDFELKLTIILEKLIDTINNNFTKISETMDLQTTLIKSIDYKKIITQLQNELNNFANYNSQYFIRLNETIMDYSQQINFDYAVLSRFIPILKEHNDFTNFSNVNVDQIYLFLNNLNDYFKEMKAACSQNNYGNQKEKLHAVEANFHEGVLKILTNTSNTRDLNSFINNSTENYLHTPLDTLSNLIEMDNISITINDPNLQKTKDNNYGTMRNADCLDCDTFTKLVLLYLKAYKNNISKDLFLKEINSLLNNTYDSLADVITHLKGKVSNDFLNELDYWNNQQILLNSKLDQYNEKEDYDNSSE